MTVMMMMMMMMMIMIMMRVHLDWVEVITRMAIVIRCDICGLVLTLFNQFTWPAAQTHLFIQQGAFRRIDRNGDGFITWEEFQRVNTFILFKLPQDSLSFTNHIRYGFSPFFVFLNFTIYTVLYGTVSNMNLKLVLNMKSCNCAMNIY